MTHLLIDENLPASLVQMLPVACTYATEIAPRPTDTELWNFARQNHWTLMTRDADFFDRIILHGPPPKIIWIRLGNIRKADLEALLLRRWQQICQLLTNADLVVVHPQALEALTCES